MKKYQIEVINKASYKYLILIFLAAITLRVYWLLTQTFVIESEGAEYASIARNLLQGNGYIGSLVGGTQLLFPPLYPILIAACSLMTGNFETAGRFVSVTFGSFLVLPIFFISLRIYGKRVALIAATIVAFHPLLIALSASISSEAPFLTLVMGGMYWGLRSLQLERVKDNILSGVCFGLAYLTRPEAILYPISLVLVISLVTLADTEKFKKAVLAFGVLLFSFALLAAPYVIFLSIHIGQIRIEGKSAINYAIAQRMNLGMSYTEASYGLSEDLREEGPILNPNIFIRSSSPPTDPQAIIPYILAAAARNIGPLFGFLRSRSFGDIILLSLVLFGLCRRAWRPQRLMYEGVLLLSVALHVGLLLSVYPMYRYMFPLLPFLILWTAKGIDELCGWARSTAANVRCRFLPSPKSIEAWVRFMLIVSLLTFSATGVRDVYDFDQAKAKYLSVKDAGLWLGQYRSGPKRIMDVEAIISYYAEGSLLSFPFAQSLTSLRYIEAKSPDFIVLKGHQVGSRPYMEEWIRNGIPDGRAELIYEKGDALEEKIIIYRWKLGQIGQ